MSGKTFVIAEAGSTWRTGKAQRHLGYAKEAIWVAQRAGADAVKFQWTSNPGHMEHRRTVRPGTYEILAWPQEWLERLRTECGHAGIEFMCTVYLPQDVPIVAPFIQRFKIASLEAQDRELFDAHKPYGKPVIISTGCMTDDELSNYWVKTECATLSRKFLHCAAAYPPPVEHLNLLALNRHCISGLSDHSCDVLTGALAVAAGAKIVEVHFRIDGSRHGNPDYDHSLSPSQLKEYIANIRKAEIMLGDGQKKIEPCEHNMLTHRVLT